MIHNERDGKSADVMIEAIRSIPKQNPPSATHINGLLDGLDVVIERTQSLLSKASQKPE